MFTVLLSFTSDGDSKKMRTVIVGLIVKELSIQILSFSVHLLHLGDLLHVLLAAADEDGGREKNDEHVTNVENVDTET